ncbi:MAG: hypothetical protein NTZ13_00155 [Candidatus Parcubacteria bacterium]|nr:hypothetical protein [Candidatus Parcubacteria bacterium]
METVQFEEQPRIATHQKKGAFLPSLIIKFSHGKVENENQANLVLFTGAVIIFVLAFFVAFTGGTTKSSLPEPLIKTDIERMINQPIPKK